MKIFTYRRIISNSGHPVKNLVTFKVTETMYILFLKHLYLLQLVYKIPNTKF